jgi:hypothetical protein
MRSSHDYNFVCSKSRLVFLLVDSRRPLTLRLAARVRVPAYHIHSTFFFTSFIQLLYYSSTRLAYGKHVKNYSSNILSTIFSTSLGNQPSEAVAPQTFGTHGTGRIFPFRCVSSLVKSAYYLRHVSPPVRLSAWNNSAPHGQIVMNC